jgi:hypothetical protein
VTEEAAGKFQVLAFQCDAEGQHPPTATTSRPGRGFDLDDPFMDPVVVFVGPPCY